MSDRPVLLFVCVKNGGKSQLAAAVARHLAGDRVEVHSAGTRPGGSLNAEAVESLTEIGIEVGDEHPKPIDAELLARADRVIVLGTEAELTGRDDIEVWETDEPSRRGIGGMDRMRLVRDDIAERVRGLLAGLSG